MSYNNNVRFLLNNGQIKVYFFVNAKDEKNDTNKDSKIEIILTNIKEKKWKKIFIILEKAKDILYKHYRANTNELKYNFIIMITKIKVKMEIIKKKRKMK